MKMPKHTALMRLLLFVAATALIVYALPRTDERHYSYEINRPWGYSLITAPFDIPVHLDSISVRAVKDSLDASFVPVYMRDSRVEEKVIQEYKSRLAAAGHQTFTPAEQAMLERRVRQLFSDGIVDQSTYSQISSGKLPYVRFIANNVARSVSTSRYRSPRKAYAWLDSVLAAPSYHQAIEKRSAQSAGGQCPARFGGVRTAAWRTVSEGYGAYRGVAAGRAYNRSWRYCDPAVVYGS